MNHQQQLEKIIDDNTEIMQDQHCVYRLFYSVQGKPDACITVMAKVFSKSLDNIAYSLGYFFKNQFEKRKLPNAYVNFYKYVYENQNGTFSIDFRYVGNSPYEALKTTYVYLQPASTYSLLNANRLPLIPQVVQRKGDRVWINRGHYLNFRTWQQKFDLNVEKGLRDINPSDG